MRTTALYDNNLKQFVLHTPDFEAAKCWVGSLGKNEICFQYLLLHMFVMKLFF